MKISMDKKYRTRDGRDVRLLCVDGPKRAPVIGIISGEDGADAWNAEGLCFHEESPFDLIEYHKPDIRTIWVNVYEDFAAPYRREEDAKAYSQGSCISIAQPVTFEVKK